MEVKQIKEALDNVFHKENARIVFWNDPEQEFLSSLPEILSEDITLIKLNEIGALEVKIRIERNEAEKKFLLYSPEEEPDYHEDWLLDVRLYSQSFRADRASILLNDLGLSHHQSLRDYISRRRRFFDSKDRLQKLKPFIESNDNELDLDRKMLAVLTRSDQAELFNIVRTLFQWMTMADEIDFKILPPVWDQIEKFDLDKSLWELVKLSFGYSEEIPSLGNLLIRLMVSDYIHDLKGNIPTALQNLQLPPSGISNAVVCLDQWRDSSSKGESYNKLAEEVALKIRIEEHLNGVEIEEVLGAVTFLEIEKAIIRGLLNRVCSTADHIDAVNIRDIATRRQSGHWVSSLSIPEQQRKARQAVYEALAVSAEFFDLRNQYREGFHYDSQEAMYEAYEKELYKFDQRYRHFCENADLAESQGWDMLKALRNEIEACYCNWYLTKMGLAWGKYVEELLKEWVIKNIPNQYRFYERNVSPQLKEGEKRRVFVIISDAFRYEVAQELTSVLNGKYRFEASLASQLGVLPSYTALGMASLLPHKKLEYTKKGDVLADGKATSSLEYRNDLLSEVTGVAVKAEDLLAMKQEEGREFISDKKVIYIYHDKIDAVGEKTSTEGDTFEAVRRAIQEIGDLVSYVVNTLNGNYVIVTADHGFLFTESAPDETDKSKLEDKPKGTIKAKKRYLLGQNLPKNDEVWYGKTRISAKAEGDMEFWIPKGANRFHFAGGAKFIHGGAMLQEVLVPVITVKQAKSKSSKEKTKIKNVMVQVLGTKHKITTQSHRFTLVQMEPIRDRIRPITLKVAIYEDKKIVSSIEKITFDSTSDKMDDRQKSLLLTLQDRHYNKKTRYRLLLQDVDTDIEQQSIDVIIDRAIADDFDF
jgi:uncharacterized protein (TIGR02687 family)